MYLLFYKERWELEEHRHNMPVHRRQYLLDLCNCNGKKGVDVFNVLERQFQRIGLSPHEAAAGCGDGGGENEGAQGAHALFEERNPSYVRRRCLAHIPWRVADQGLKEAGHLHDELKSISEYFHEGVTWLRLQAIAVQRVAEGGLGVCAADSRMYRALFGAAPPKPIQELCS